MTFRNRMRRVGDCSGQSLVEFSISVFLLLMLLIGVVEIGRMLLVYTTVANAARVGARYAIVHAGDSTGTQAVIDSYLSAAPLDLTRVTTKAVTACSVPTLPCPSGSASTAIGSYVTVQVVYSYDPFTTYFPLTTNLGSTSQGVIAF